MTPKHLGILQDIRRKGFYKLEECGPWMCDQLVEIIMLDGPPLITVNDDYIVTLASEGWKVTQPGENDHARRPGLCQQRDTPNRQELRHSRPNP